MRERRLFGMVTAIALVVMACATASGTPPPAASPTPTPSLAGGGGGASGPATSSPSATTAASATIGPTPSLGKPDPCALITESDATTLIGPTVVHTQGGGADTKGPCVFSDGTHDSVAVAIRVAPDAATAAQLLTAQMNSMSSATEGFMVTALTGLGDSAFEAKKKAGGLIADGIYVELGPTYFYITTLSETKDPSDDAFMTAARTAIGSLRSNGY